MNIIRKKGFHPFCKVDLGGVFEYEDRVFMKFEDITTNGNMYNAICLADGMIDYFRDDEPIRFVDADLVIY